MEPATVLAFTLVASILTVTPGADMALVAHTTLTRGRRAAMVATIGICCGLAVHAIASSVGLSSILARSATAYAIVKTLGACYLILLGVMALRASWRGEPNERAIAPPRGSPFIQGLVSNVLNPKVALFYLTFLPQFVDPSGGSILWQSLALAGIHLLTGILWLPMWSWMVERAGAAFGKGGFRRWLQRATGGVLVILGARLLLERRGPASVQG